MIKRERINDKSTHWARLAIAANTHLRKALLNILHNRSNDPIVQGVPSDPENLYNFLQKSKKKIQNLKLIKGNQYLILFPPSVQSVDSSEFDITLINYLIRTFCQIRNAKGRFDEPDGNDTTLYAYVYRAVGMRNRIYHYGDIHGLDEKIFESLWAEIKTILKGLKYAVDIEPDRTAMLDISKLQCENLKEFRDHLENYKEEMSKRVSEEFHVERRFSIKNDENKDEIVTDNEKLIMENDRADFPLRMIETRMISLPTLKRDEIVTDIEKLIMENDRVIIYGEAGIGKTFTARKIKHDWSKGIILDGFNLIYFNSKQINQKLRYPGNAAPLFFSDLGDYFKGKGETAQKLAYYDCVTMPIEKLIILVDGIDEFPIENTVNKNYVDELEKKILNKEQISAVDTINAIYFGFLFPYSKVCLLGRTLEFERLKKIKIEKEASILNEKNLKIKDCKLLKFNDRNVEEFTCYKICEQVSKGKRTCTEACHEIYEKIKDVELCKIPTDLNSLLELQKNNLYQSVGKITRTKLMIATLLNRINEHTKLKNYEPYKTFGKIRQQKEKNNLLECIRTLGEMSFKALSNDSITIKVKEKEGSDGTVYFEDENKIKVERKTFEDLDLFYVRDCVYHFNLEPHHTLNVEFLSACYLFSQPADRNSISKLNEDRQFVIIPFIAGLHMGDPFTEDFVINVFKTSDYLLESFFSWFYDSTSSDLSSSDSSWYGMKKIDLSASFFFLDLISQEVEIPENHIPKTIIYFGNNSSSHEWYKMKRLKQFFSTKGFHNLNMESFLERFPEYNFRIIFYDSRLSNHQFNLLNKFKANSRFAFRIGTLQPKSNLLSNLDLKLNVDKLWIDYSRRINKILNAVSPTSAIRCAVFVIRDIQYFKKKQVKKLFAICLSGVVESILLKSMFTAEQIDILIEMESRHTKIPMVDIIMEGLDFKHVLDLPNLGNRNLFLSRMENINDENLREFSKHIIPGPNEILANYKIMGNSIYLYRKRNDLPKHKQLMYLRLSQADFTSVSPDVFASTFLLIPSLSFLDDEEYIPTSHWRRLSEEKQCRINEMRIWDPQSKNFEHFLNIRLNMIQFSFRYKDEFKELIDYIANNPNVQLVRKIKVFVAQYDICNCDDYEEIVLFERETIKENKKIINFDDLRSIDFQQIYENNDKNESYWLSFCCEISYNNEGFAKKNTDLSNTICSNDDSISCDTDGSYDKEIEDILNDELETDDSDSFSSNSSFSYSSYSSSCFSSNSSSSSSESSDDETEDESNENLETNDLENEDNRIDNKNYFLLWVALAIGLGICLRLLKS